MPEGVRLVQLLIDPRGGEDADRGTLLGLDAEGRVWRRVMVDGWRGHSGTDYPTKWEWKLLPEFAEFA